MGDHPFLLPFPTFTGGTVTESTIRPTFNTIASAIIPNITTTATTTTTTTASTTSVLPDLGTNIAAPTEPTMDPGQNITLDQIMEFFRQHGVPESKIPAPDIFEDMTEAPTEPPILAQQTGGTSRTVIPEFEDYPSATATNGTLIEPWAGNLMVFITISIVVFLFHQLTGLLYEKAYYEVLKHKALNGKLTTWKTRFWNLVEMLIRKFYLPLHFQIPAIQECIENRIAFVVTAYQKAPTVITDPGNHGAGINDLSRRYQDLEPENLIEFVREIVTLTHLSSVTGKPQAVILPNRLPMNVSTPPAYQNIPLNLPEPILTAPLMRTLDRKSASRDDSAISTGTSSQSTHPPERGNPIRPNTRGLSGRTRSITNSETLDSSRATDDLYDYLELRRTGPGSSRTISNTIFSPIRQHEIEKRKRRVAFDPPPGFKASDKSIASGDSFQTAVESLPASHRSTPVSSVKATPEQRSAKSSSAGSTPWPKNKQQEEAPDGALQGLTTQEIHLFNTNRSDLTEDQKRVARSVERRLRLYQAEQGDADHYRQQEIPSGAQVMPEDPPSKVVYDDKTWEPIIQESQPNADSSTDTSTSV